MAATQEPAMEQARRTVHVLLRRGEEVLVAREAGCARLPRIQVGSGWLASQCDEIRDAVADAFDLRVSVLRVLSVPDGRACVELELHGGTLRRGGGVEFASVEPYVEVDDELCSALQLRCAAARAPWQERGWFAQAEAWIDACLRREGLSRRGRVSQVKAAWAGSAVMAVETTAGRFFFKATSGRPHEAAVTQRLAQRWAGHVLELADMSEEGFMLTRDHGGRELGPDDYGAALRDFAILQAAEAAEQARWHELGCLDRSPRALADCLPPLLRRVSAAFATAGLLDHGRAQVLSEFADTARALCFALAELGIADSIHHEDFRPDNVVLRGTRPVFFDWADTVVSHPFFSLQRFLDDVRDRESSDVRAEHRPPWVDGYLEVWSAIHGVGRVERAFELTRLLQSSYMLVRYDAAVDLAAWSRGSPPAEERTLCSSVLDALFDAAHAARDRVWT